MPPSPTEPSKKTAAKRTHRRIVSDSDSEDEPVARPAPAKRRRAAVAATSEESAGDSEDEPIATKPAKGKAKGTAIAAPSRPPPAAAAAAKPAKAKPAKRAAPASSSSDSEDEPIAAKPKRARTAAVKAEPTAAKKTAAAKKVKAEPPSSSPASSSSSSSAAPAAAKKRAPVKKEAKGKAAGKVKKEEAAAGSGDEADGGADEYKWWLQENPLDNDGVKWTSLSHNGVYFAPEYVPHGVPLLYDGNPVQLGAEAEEVATFYAAVVGTQHEENEIFRKNFFDDFTEVLERSEPASCPIKQLDLCDFSRIVDHLAAERERKKAATKADKEAAKKEKADLDEKYGWATIDGRREKIGNYRVEPPSLFRGRGAHPKAGKLKKRVVPEDITINIGPNDPVPPPPEGHQWKKVVHENTVTWLATWTENVNGQPKYVFLSATSSWKGMSDFKKFEKARELKKVVGQIRADYTAMLKDREMEKRQLATALYFIDRFALRAGNEKGEDEADTVGCCSLRFEHVTLHEDNKVVFDFLGKDSIRYYNEVTVDAQVHKNLKLFKKGHTDGDDLFDRIDTTSLNKHLHSIMPGLTAKVFRTYNASHTFQEQLEKTPADGSVSEMVLAYNRANREVAVLCNHQRTVSKGFGQQMERIRNKLRAFKYQRREVKAAMLKLDPKLKRTRKELAEPESDLDEDWIESHLEAEALREAERDAKKLAKLNEQREADGESPLAELPNKRDPAAAAASKREQSLEQLEKKYAQLSAKIEATKVDMVDRDENKATALGTSKINYIDPRITAAWCKKYEVPIDKMFPKTLRDKFKWAMDVDADWEF
ncbi:DNA topoisomerase 1 [Blastocladiella emersonii ATCC 22665]|nr:DNA topoisomerase 1 [Blastocladiella emersonii ATCC 22665]